MEDTLSKDLQAKKKTGVPSPAEQTRPGLIFTPAVDIFETEQNITMVADMPGVIPENLSIDLKDNVLTLIGDVQPPEKGEEVALYKEYQTGRYYRQFSLSEMIDQSKIEATMKEGVLNLVLPKVVKAAARKIEVKAA
jgi:HSP20 family protein